MLLSDQEVGQSLRALRSRTAPGVAGHPGGRHLYRVPAQVGDVIRRQPTVRPDFVDAARSRLEDGWCPSDADLAKVVVGRLVCDRLR